jgi:hypothetical protein
MEFTLGSTFRMFADTYEPVSAANPTPNLRPGNGHYDAPNPPTVPGDVPSQQYALNNGVTVSKFCGITTASAQYCTDSSGANQITKLDVVFSRPNTLASTSVYTTASTWLWEGFNRSCITLSTPQGATRHITVSRIGQISIAPSCP